MPHLEDCKGIIRRLIAKGDTNNAPLAERAINEYLLATPVQARKSGLRFLQEDVLAQRNAVLGSPRAIADTIFDYILRGGSVMKYLCEFASEGCAAAAAVLWFVSASIRLKKPNRISAG